MKLRASRTGRRGRVEIIPMIDVMFFLLATFMLASLTMENLHSLRVNLPSGTARPLAASQAPTLTITREGTIAIDGDRTSLDGIAALIAPRLGTDHSVVVNADADAPNGIVVQAMLRAQTAGAEKFLFAIRKE